MIYILRYLSHKWMMNKYYKIVNLKETMTAPQSFQLSEDLRRWFEEQKGYVIGQKIGQGLECAVYLINISQQNPKPYALKITKLVKTVETNHLLYPRQILKLKLQSLLLSSHLPSHPSLPQIRESGFCSQYGFMVMEYLPNHNFLQFYKKYLTHKTPDICEQIKRECIRHILGQIAVALFFFQEQGIIHRDIKMQNIMFDKDHRVKIIDFSMTILEQIQNEQIIENFEQQIEELQNDLLNHQAKRAPPVYAESDLQNTLTLSKIIHKSNNLISGSRQYLCPQSIAPQSSPIPLTSKIDIWALGVMAYRLFFGKFPIQNASKLSNFVLFNKIREQIPTYPEPDEENDEESNEQLKMQIQFVKGCLQKDYQKRLSAKQVLQLRYFSKLSLNPQYCQNIYQQHNPIIKVLEPNLFVQEWKWISPQKMRIKFIPLSQKSPKQLFTYNKFSKLTIGLKQQSNGHHYLQFTNEKLPSNKNNKTKSSHAQQPKKIPLLRIKTKYCHIIKDFSTKNKILVRIEILSPPKCQNEKQIREIDVQFMKEDVLEDFLHAIAEYRR